MRLTPKRIVRPKVGDSVRFKDVEDSFTFKVVALDSAWDHCVHHCLNWRDEYRVHIRLLGGTVVPYLEHELSIVIPQENEE